mgnify:CR=1 FL=1
MPGKRKYSPAVGSEIDSNESNVSNFKWGRLILCGCISVLIAIAFISFIKYEVNDYFESTEIDRLEIDKRIASISEHCKDYESHILYNCTIKVPCDFNCSYITNNLYIEMSQCSYNDYYDFWSIIETILIWCVAFCLTCSVGNLILGGLCYLITERGSSSN